MEDNSLNKQPLTREEMQAGLHEILVGLGELREMCERELERINAKR